MPDTAPTQHAHQCVQILLRARLSLSAVAVTHLTNAGDGRVAYCHLRGLPYVSLLVAYSKVNRMLSASCTAHHQLRLR